MRRLALVLLGLLVAMTAPHAQVGVPLVVPEVQFVDGNGVPLAGGKLYTCSAGSTCPGAGQINTFTDCTNSVANANPVILDSNGRAQICLSATTYKYVLQNSSGATVWTVDNVPAGAAWNVAAFTGKVTYTAPTVLIVSSNAVTPTGNFHAIDTSGGAQNLNTINTTNVVTGFVLTIYGNNVASDTVTVVNGGGNIQLRKGNYVLNNNSRFITLMLSGATWYELDRSDMNDAVIAPELRSYSESEVSVPISSGTLTIDMATGNHFAVTINQNITTFSILNTCGGTSQLPQASGSRACAFTLACFGNGSGFTQNWGSVKWPSGTAPTLTTTNNKVDILTFYTNNGGATFYGFVGGQNF